MCSCATDEKRKKHYQDANQQKRTCKWTMVTQATNQDLTHGSDGAKNTQKHKLPNMSPELAVTKTQLSLGRKRRRKIWRFRVLFTVDLSSFSASHSWTDQGRQLGCQIITSQTLFGETHRSLFMSHEHQYMEHFLSFSVLFSHQSSVSIFVPFQTLPLLINLLIRNYANDLKTKRTSVRQYGVSVRVLWRVCPKKIQPAEKSSSKTVSPAPLVSHLPPLPLERGDREEEERRIRVRIRGLLHWN